jgi:hypothetical protein
MGTNHDRMTYREYVESKTIKELKKELKELEDLIDVMECFNTRDLILREEIEIELLKRESLKRKGKQ